MCGDFMRFKKLILLFTVMISTLFFVCSVYAEETDTQYETKTLLMEAFSGSVVKHNGGHDKVPQGTLNKLMTVLLAAEEIECKTISLDTVVTAGNNAGTQKGAVVWIVPGEKITVSDLLKAIIIGNANDATEVLAEEICGDEKEFVGMMNARAFELGMRNTVFKNSAGYDCNGQYSTAYDIALLCRELLKHEFLYEIMNTWTDIIRDGQTEIVNENRLVRTYEGIIGFKASHSDSSGYCLAIAAEREGKRYIAIVLGENDKDERFSTAKSLLSDGFSYFKLTTPSFSGEFIKPVTVKGGLDRAVCITAGSLKGMVVPENNGEISTVVMIPEYIDAPVKKGQKIGCVGFYNGDTLIYETDLITETSVKAMSFGDSISIFLHNLYK